MTDHSEAARAAILARLAQSREELRMVFEPPPTQPDADGGSRHTGFPRSRTIQMLMSGRGLGTLGALAAGLFAARPALALRLLRMLPATAIGRMLLLRAFTALRAKQP
ncbi:MAG: hypothetical protein WA642_00245 [Steroidobacteraceae bacterium]